MRAADVSDGIRIAAELAITLTQAVCINDIVAEAWIVCDSKSPLVCLTLIHRTSFSAFPTGDRRRNGVHPFVIGNGTFERRVVEIEAMPERNGIQYDGHLNAGCVRDNV